jgi:hypothetical protein
MGAPRSGDGTLPHNWKRYNHKGALRCRCDDCRLDWNRHCNEYKQRVRDDVRAGRRKSPNWLRTEQGKAHQDALKNEQRREYGRERIDQLKASLESLAGHWGAQLEFGEEPIFNLTQHTVKLDVRWTLTVP